MSSKNVLVHKHTKKIPYQYRLNGQDYEIPPKLDSNYSIRMWDFDWANMDDVPNIKVINEDEGNRVRFGDIGITSTPCLQYDLHFFEKHLL